MEPNEEPKYRSFMDIRYGVDKMLEEAERRRRELEARPVPHGARPDERYPSPRTLRRMLGFSIDWLLHASVAVTVFVNLPTSLPAASIALVPFTWLALSFIHRVVIQSATQTTLGKAIFGLRIIRPDNGTRPDFSFLAQTWIKGVFASLRSLRRGDSGFNFIDEVRGRHPVFPCSVRTIDLKETADPLRA